jgi:hypothetical protein
MVSQVLGSQIENLSLIVTLNKILGSSGKEFTLLQILESPESELVLKFYEPVSIMFSTNKSLSTEAEGTLQKLNFSFNSTKCLPGFEKQKIAAGTEPVIIYKLESNAHHVSFLIPKGGFNAFLPEILKALLKEEGSSSDVNRLNEIIWRISGIKLTDNIDAEETISAILRDGNFI